MTSRSPPWKTVWTVSGILNYLLRLAVLFRKFGALVHGPGYEVDRPYLCFVVVTQFLVENEGLQHKINTRAFPR